MGNHKKLLQFLRPDPAVAAAPRSSSSSDSDSDDGDASYSPLTTPSTSGASSATSTGASPFAMSPWTTATAAASPFAMSPWTTTTQLLPGLGADSPHQQQQTTAGLLGSLVKADGGHVYSLAAAGDLLYTGTDSRNVRVWRDRRELGGFRSGSGLVKAIVVSEGGRIFTGHQDGKVRVWTRRDDDECVRHRRVGSLPRPRHVVAGSLSLVRSVARLRHLDAVSCLSLDAAAGLLYSGSWDKTVKVWRVSDSRCVESIPAHDDAVNAVAAAGFDALLFTGSADGTVKVWRRHHESADHKKKKGGMHHAVERVLRQGGDGAVTAIAVSAEARVVYVGSSDGAVTHWQFRRSGLGSEAAAAPPPRNGGALRGHRMAVLCLAVSGRVVVSGSADRTVSVWRREEGAAHVRLAVLKGHAGPVKCVAALYDEEENGEAGGERRRWVVYSGSLDGSVKVWRVAADSSRSPELMATPTHARTLPPLRKPSAPPSPLTRSWTTPYAAAAASPEPGRLGAAA